MFLRDMASVPLKLTRNAYLHGALVGPPLVIAVDVETARTLIGKGYAEALATAEVDALRAQPAFPVAHAASPAVVPTKKRKG